MSKITVRALILAAALALASGPAAQAQTSGQGVWSFVSSPRLHPPAVAVTAAQPGTADGDLFVAPIAVSHMLGQPGPLIFDGQGNPVWAHPLRRGVAMDFRPQMYLGRPVLTWWQGTVSSQGIGTGEGVIVDGSYRQVARVRAGNGFAADLHEFRITGRGTALITAYKAVRWHGYELWDSVVQEVDIRTGRVWWQWDPLRHVPLWQSYTQPVKGWIWDPYHVNSVDVDSAGNLLISARNTWAAYKVNRRSGRILWQLGGKASTFKLEPGVRFAYQHHIRFQPNDDVSLFDDGAAPKVESLSRGLVVHLDLVHRAAHLVRAYSHPGLLAGSQGSMQVLANGDAFVGWGQVPYLSEYSPDGRLLFDAHFYGSDESYRAYRMRWVGRPRSLPALAVQGGTLYASWNGETGIAAWQVLAGSRPDRLAPLGSVQRAGFETGIRAGDAGPYYAVRALDARGGALGTSPVVRR
jgi:hypothetical protein